MLTGDSDTVVKPKLDLAIIGNELAEAVGGVFESVSHDMQCNTRRRLREYSAEESIGQFNIQKL